MTKNITTKIQVRQDTAENWKSKNPILATGEFGYDTTYNQTKIGDGVTAWGDLDWFATKSDITPLSFANADWSTIAKVAASGKAEVYYNVGDEKTIELSTGEEVTLVILGFNHDDLSDGSGKAAISIGMKNLLATFYRMNLYNLNTTSWGDSEMCLSTMATFLSQLPSDLQAAIKSVNKLTSAGGRSTTIITSSDKLWLPALAEIFSKTSITGSSNSNISTNATVYQAEGEQYAYYKNLIGDNDGGTAKNAALIKYLSNGTGDASDYWLRSPYIVDQESFHVIYSTGIPFYRTANFTKYGVSFGFCI